MADQDGFITVQKKIRPQKEKAVVVEVKQQPVTIMKPTTYYGLSKSQFDEISWEEFYDLYTQHAIEEETQNNDVAVDGIVKVSYYPGTNLKDKLEDPLKYIDIFDGDKKLSDTKINTISDLYAFMASFLGNPDLFYRPDQLSEIRKCIESINNKKYDRLNGSETDNITQEILSAATMQLCFLKLPSDGNEKKLKFPLLPDASGKRNFVGLNISDNKNTFRNDNGKMSGLLVDLLLSFYSSSLAAGTHYSNSINSIVMMRHPIYEKRKEGSSYSTYIVMGWYICVETADPVDFVRRITDINTGIFIDSTKIGALVKEHPELLTPEGKKKIDQRKIDSINIPKPKN